MWIDKFVIWLDGWGWTSLCPDPQGTLQLHKAFEKYWIWIRFVLLFIWLGLGNGQKTNNDQVKYWKNHLLLWQRFLSTAPNFHVWFQPRESTSYRPYCKWTAPMWTHNILRKVRGAFVYFMTDSCACLHLCPTTADTAPVISNILFSYSAAFLDVSVFYISDPDMWNQNPC